jgi:hypothetical protein
VPLSAFPITYKYGVREVDSSLTLEHGENRMVAIPPSQCAPPRPTPPHPTARSLEPEPRARPPARPPAASPLPPPPPTPGPALPRPRSYRPCLCMQHTPCLGITISCLWMCSLLGLCLPAWEPVVCHYGAEAPWELASGPQSCSVLTVGAYAGHQESLPNKAKIVG